MILSRLWVVACLVPLLTGTSAAPVATTPEAEAFRLVNAARDKRDIAKLVRKAALDEIAERHSKRMRDADDLFHSSNLGERVPGEWRGIGENVGYAGSVLLLHRALMKSPPHRANILRASWDQIGIGIVRSSSGQVYETQIFVDR